jgi:hypothetical protein
MDVSEPLLRRRGFFLHSDTTGEPDTGEHENPEGFVVRIRITHSHAFRQPPPRAISSARFTGGRSHSDNRASADEGHPAIRSGSVTGSRQRAHLPR